MAEGLGKRASLRRAVDGEIAAVEQVSGSFGRANSDAHVRHVERAHVLEHGPVVLVVAEANNTSRVVGGEKGAERASFAGPARVNVAVPMGNVDAPADMSRA